VVLVGGGSLGGGEAVPFVEGSAEKTVAQFESYKKRIIGFDAADIDGMARLLREIDGTRDYSRIGGSLAYAVSVAGAEAEGRLRVHGWYYDILTGRIEEYDEGLGRFVPWGE